MKSVCTDRYMACWGSCPKYIEAKAAHEEQKKKKEQEKKPLYYMT